MSSTSLPGSVPRKMGRRRINRLLLAYALVAPAVVWRLGVAGYPFLHTIFQSFTDESPLNPVTHVIGFRNYTDMFNDVTVTETLTFTAIFTIASTTLQIVYGLAIAALLNRSFPGRTLVRAVNLLPWAMPAIVIASAAQWMLNDQYGMVDDLIVRVLNTRPIWLADPNLARVAVILLDTWKNAPFCALILLAGLQNIPDELYDAAKMDGASRWYTFRAIVVPMLTPLLITLTIFVATTRVITFDIVYGLTQGGPGSSTSLLSYQLYKEAFLGLYFGYGAAIAVFTFLIVLVISVVGFIFLRRSSEGM